MSKRAERREAERLARKTAYQQKRQPAAAEPSALPPDDAELLTRAQAFFDRPAHNRTSTDAQIAANRANARHSTGPVTSSGKAIASRNHTSHGLTASTGDAENFLVLPTEDQSQYDRHLAEFQADWKPSTATEHDLVHRLVVHKWLRMRALRLQNTLFSPETGELTDNKKFELYRRYETTHERGFNKCLADLQRLRAFQQRQQIGFESQQRKNAEHALKMQRLKSRQQAEKTPASDTMSGAHVETSHLDDISVRASDVHLGGRSY